MEEGGLGIRNLKDIRKDFIMKKCWLVSCSDSIWGFMRSKYHITPSPIYLSGPQRCSPEWRELVSAWLSFAQRRGWTVGKGEIYFWFDNRNAELSFESMAMDGFPMDKLRDFWDSEQWTFDELILTLGEELIQYALERALVILRMMTYCFGSSLCRVLSRSSRLGTRFGIGSSGITLLVWYRTLPFLPNQRFLFGAF